MSSQSLDNERHWYVVYSKPHKENAAKFHIAAKGLEVFFPRLLLPRSARKTHAIIPLFPNYLFVRMNVETEEYAYVSWSPGVSRVIGFNGRPAPMDEEVLSFLQSKSDPDGIIKAESKLRSGQEVRITDGPFTGLMGIIRNPPDAKGRVKVLLNLLNRPAAVDLPIEFIETTWSAAALGTGTRKS
jgi:transcriptional antiterminator RfaH